MRIGLDFDNTIVSYDRLFHAVAVDEGLVPATVSATKLAVRGHLRAAGREDDWTALQGRVYGLRMSEADAYPGVHGFLACAREAGDEVFIVSHKTRHPYLGPRYDLHAAARDWVYKRLRRDGEPLVSETNVFFEQTKAAKIARIRDVECDWFVDDLPEIFDDASFPDTTAAMLFDPGFAHAVASGRCSVRSWKELQDELERCR